MDIQAQILKKQHEMEELRAQMQALNQKHLEALYPGRCFQYCIDHDLGTQDELALLPGEEVILRAERGHFADVARKMPWTCGNDGCAGWDSIGDTCECGTKRFYWMYEEKLPLTDSTILQPPAASVVDQ